MHNQTILVAIIALLIGGIGGYAIGQKDIPYGPYGNHTDMMGWGTPTEAPRMSDGTPMNGSPGAGGMHNMMEMSVSSEREFITGMIPHHQEAIDTAREVLERGATTPEIRALMESIIAAQTAEIAEMKQWHQDWYGEPYTDDGTYEPMMRELAELSGADIDRAFLEDMMMHHMGAIMMARSVQPYIEHEEIATLTQNIVESQSSEIMEMRQLLQTL